MKSTFISKEKNEVKFTMEFTGEEFDNAVIKAYQGSKEKYAVDGFRKGKAPRKLIESKYGEDVFYEDAVNQMFSMAYPEAIKELDLKPIDRPKAEFGELKSGQPLLVTLELTVQPEFEVKDYKGVKIEKVEHTVSDEDVDKEIEALRKRNSRMVLVERPAQSGDTVLIDYSGFVGDHQFEGGTAERQPLELGSGSFIPGFEDQLIGANVGEERNVKVTFPEQYHSEELAGQEAIFKCKVHEIKETELPEVNDEFAKDVSEFDTLEELRKDTREKLEKSATSRNELETKNKVLEAVYEANEIDIPEVMIEDTVLDMMQEFDQQLRMQGMDLSKYLGYINKEPEQLKEEMRPDALKRTKTRMIVEAVANKENFEVTEEDLDQELQSMADQYKMEVDKLKEAMGPDNFAALKQDIKMRRAVEFMFENAIIA